MPTARYLSSLDDAVIATGLDAIRAEIGVIDTFDAAAAAEAEIAARRGPTLPPGVSTERGWIDRRDLDLVAIDPPGSRDLDQALAAETTDQGYRVWYAIADVAAFVAPGGALEAASLERGVTMYAPDRRVSLHPVAINEHAASLLPGQDRPCCLWRIDLDHEGRPLDTHVERATVRVREAISYRHAQDEIDAGNPRSSLRHLASIGRLRQALEVDRGAVSLTLPGQEISRQGDRYHIHYDESLPVEGWNAQISLLTGIVAAELMLGAGVGILRTLPPADPVTVDELRRTARALHVDWPAAESYADRVRRLDPSEPKEAALGSRAARALRGAGYLAFTDNEQLATIAQADLVHAAIASTYAHVTAPLRRVCDRYANEALLAICADAPIPTWAVDTIAELPSVMGRCRQREAALDRAILDYMEAVVLEQSVGQRFDAVVVNHRDDNRRGGETTAVIQLGEPAVIATLQPAPPLGAEISVRLTAADPARRRVEFELA